MKEWYALHTKLYRERKIAVRLERHDIETYVPETQSKSERSSARPVPFFPGYMFIRVDMDEANPSYWRFTPDVRYMVSYGDEPIAVADELIHTMRRELAAVENAKRQPQARFQPGERVRVTSGPFQDMVAIFDGPSEPAERVQILLEVMSRYKRIRISGSELERVNSENEKPKEKRTRRTRGRGRPIRA